jgi:hypothetical protein
MMTESVCARLLLYLSANRAATITFRGHTPKNSRGPCGLRTPQLPRVFAVRVRRRVRTAMKRSAGREQSNYGATTAEPPLATSPSRMTLNAPAFASGSISRSSNPALPLLRKSAPDSSSSGPHRPPAADMPREPRLSPEASVQAVHGIASVRQVAGVPRTPAARVRL